MKETQERWVINQLRTNGEVTRNEALKQYITRLGAIICNLTSSGWEINGQYRKTDFGKDFVYILVKEAEPKPLKMF